MNELQKIIEGFKKAEETCRKLISVPSTPHSQIRFLGKAEAYKVVVRKLEDFMSKQGGRK